MNDPTRTPFAGARPDSGGEDRNIVDLLGHLTQQGAHLAREQISLVKAEIREATTDIKAAIAAMATAAVVGIAGLGVLLMGIAYYVARAIDDLALGTTLVGAATMLVALVLYLGARKKIDASHLKPDRSIETLADTPTVATGDLHHSGAR
ncbi:phage holin family protein [Erythrobacter sp. WG]|uniref:phage holin family protein n=1 Tax=Erythrobacter sp. WG TaxID=2985510 RepID=UPI00226F5246|nr:phage holin family protein [Erythrobacter sp. WG]MCX9148740.1 phage holin family protein [Erythrobacter sp. WG]